ncbi:hypothetical protein Tco_0393176, partial [Tanacetum coccineum]
INPLSGSTTSSSPTLISLEESELIWEEFEAYLASDSFPLGNDDPVDLLPEEFADKLALIESFPSGNDDMTPEDDDYDDNLFDLETVNDKTYDDPFDFKEDKIKESKLLIDELNELDPPRSSDFLPSLECNSVFYEDFFEVDALPSANNEDKVFNPGILIHENLLKVTNCATPDKNVKKSTYASLILDPPYHELPLQKEVPGLGILLSFSSKNEEKVFNPGILTFKGVHSYLLPELSHWDSKAFKVTNIFENLMEIFPCSYEEDIRILDVPCLHFYPS